MTIKTDLLTEIRTTLGTSITPSLSSASAVSDIFEAYVLSLVIQAAEAEDAIISYQDVFGNVPTNFVFRTSPQLGLPHF